MIGALLSLKFVGKKGWISSLIFWGAYFIVTAFVAGLLYTIAPTISILGLVAGLFVFVSLAHLWYKFRVGMALKLYVVAFIIDLIIAFILVAILSVTLPEFWTNIFPQVSLL